MRKRVLTALYAIVCMVLLVAIFVTPILFFNGKR